ncbi:MAG: alpha/beta hydrolase [Clostridiales bacterium]|nr:alpha/beta hydrolase [Clostridiales bacterium]
MNCTKTEIRRKNGTYFKACIFKSKNANENAIGILWLHGGGYVMGAPEMAVMTMPKALLQKFNCVIICPDYTLSTDAPYPAAVEDAYRTLQWMSNNRKKLGIGYEKFAVGGESAGGGLAAALCIYARDKGNASIAFQMPLYPMLDDRVTKSSCCNDAPLWNTAANTAAWERYLGPLYGSDGVSAYAAPARLDNFINLPPAVSVIGTIEPFYEETIKYFKSLYSAGTEARLQIESGCFHAFDMVAPSSAAAKRARSFLLLAFEDYAEKYIKAKK